MSKAVETCAYLIWESEGRPERQALRHWLEAEMQLVAALHFEGSVANSQIEEVIDPTLTV